MPLREQHAGHTGHSPRLTCVRSSRCSLRWRHTTAANASSLTAWWADRGEAGRQHLGHTAAQVAVHGSAELPRHLLKLHPSKSGPLPPVTHLQA